MTGPLRRLASLLRREDGAVTVEFVLIFPVMMVFLLSSFESGLLLTRKVMLERALDITVRGLRLGQFEDPDHDVLKQAICGQATYVPDCMTSIALELAPISTVGDWALPQEAAQCVDRDAEVQELKALNAGGPNDIMLMRVCALLDPWFPTVGLGKAMEEASPNGFRLMTQSAFVNEPRAN
ncbi:pilus assembly protein [Cereibacter changlensis]|uniref:Pilus assembly protein n=1 Tax=Cereibacter changlensis TaxID=402884 RepID=A0A4V5NLS8_9RHOB|nr:TadE family protein [Cereibacter changlensis]TKA96807.1 pilus assembly protein [Cereibacter changlensis]